MWWASRHGGRLVVMMMMMMAILVAAAGCTGAASRAAGTGERAAAHPRVWLESVQMISAAAGWALLSAPNPTAGRGAPLLPARTDDGGRTWVTVAPPAIAGLAGEPIMLQAATPSRAWLAVYLQVGKRATTEVFGTENGGASWSRSAPAGSAQPMSVDFPDPAHGWLLEDLGAAMGQEGVAVYRTTDAGQRWSLTAQTLPSPRSGNSGSGLPTACDKSGMIFSSPRTGWITAYCNAGSEVLVTHDAGYHWASQSLPITAAACSPAGCSITQPQFIGQAGFLTVGHYPATGELLVSRDAGSSWQVRQLPAGAGPYPQIRFFTADRGITVSGGSQGLIGSVFYLTADGGRSWTPVPQGRQFGTVGASVDFVSTTDGFAWIPASGIAAGPAPDMYVTTNSGRTWTAITPRLA